MNKHSLQLINVGNTYLLNKGYKQVYFINYWSQEKPKSVFALKAKTVEQPFSTFPTFYQEMLSAIDQPTPDRVHNVEN